MPRRPRAAVHDWPTVDGKRKIGMTSLIHRGRALKGGRGAVHREFSREYVHAGQELALAEIVNDSRRLIGGIPNRYW